MKFSISKNQYQRGLLLILLLGILICIVQLGSTGLVDETPPLFAAAGRGMSESGDWLTPRVNGFPRFDKPPLIYWLMGFFYSLPAQPIWDPLGTWSARLPSAISTVLMMLFLGDTVMRWSTKEVLFPRRTSLVASLAFALSPLVIIWSRIAVSDALLCSTLGISMLLIWRTYAKPKKQSWIYGWIFLGLAILTKGPVAIVINIISCLLFAIHQRDYSNLVNRIKPFKGILISLFISLPWYVMELIKEGRPFWDSFFGYHNFQRLTSVVNNHQEPWWFFCIILVISSLPFTPFLLSGLYDFSLSFFKTKNKRLPENSLLAFAGCWLITIFLLFTLAATKLPSYWLPATPAAAIIIAFSSSKTNGNRSKQLIAILISSLLTFLFVGALFAFKFWIYEINDPEIPRLSIELVNSRINIKGGAILSITTLIGFYIFYARDTRKIILMQIPIIIFQLFFMLPLWKISDKLRQLPIRNISNLVLQSKFKNEQIAMVGINKPSLHFYTKEIIIYEKAGEKGLINLSERIQLDPRLKNINLAQKFIPSTILVVIDDITSQRPFWKDLNPILVGKSSIYNLWRLDKTKIEDRAIILQNIGFRSDWRNYNPERI